MRITDLLDKRSIYLGAKVSSKEETLDRDIAEPSFINVNDKTIEGVHYLGKNVQTVQFHPEACAGPLDTGFLFDEFMNMMEVSK